MTVSSQKLKIAQTQLKSLQKQIDYDTRDFPIAYMVDRFKSNDYFIPTYQRNKVWNQHDKERFIESLLLNYPIPLIFLSEQENGKLEIVGRCSKNYNFSVLFPTRVLSKETR
ncbi:DUF262 domain-containing protein [Lactiplantibacillus plantarum]|uniref:DUF262 domain-containing protein n=1 Tax=Lactiplantibacillus plantarum TaxID=1590 RepID=UPI00214AEAA7|nr:DUF262 domain-containing protein [Lactiplantibacillus plantarum]